MTEFEYFSAIIAVILALGFTHILGQIGRVAQDPSRVTFYWVHAVWVSILLLSHFAAWWNIWQQRESMQFSFAGFLYLAVGPTTLYLGARILVPSVRRSGQVNLHAHYFSVHRSFFAIMIAFFLWPALLGPVLGGETSLEGVLQHLVLVLPIGACIVWANRWVHAAVAVFSAALFVAVLVTGGG